MSQDHDSSDGMRIFVLLMYTLQINKSIFYYLNTIQSTDKHSLIKYCNSCFTELNKFMYVR